MWPLCNPFAGAVSRGCVKRVSSKRGHLRIDPSPHSSGAERELIAHPLLLVADSGVGYGHPCETVRGPDGYGEASSGALPRDWWLLTPPPSWAARMNNVSWNYT